MATQRVCKDCNKLQDVEQFPKGKNKERVFVRYSCTECVKSKRKEWNKKYYKKIRQPTKKELKAEQLKADELAEIKMKIENVDASEEYIK